MERLDFASVMAALQRNIPDEDFGNQMDFLYSLFIDVNLNPYYAVEFDQGQVCRWFLGREQELDQFHMLLVDHSKVFLRGIPGIGKNELAKAYAKQYGKEYTNVIYV